jgi:hypothetical protein
LKPKVTRFWREMTAVREIADKLEMLEASAAANTTAVQARIEAALRDVVQREAKKVLRERYRHHLSSGSCGDD